MGGVKYANIGLAIGIPVLAIGAFLFKDAGEGASYAVLFASFVTTFAVYHGLDERDKRRRRRDQ